MTNRPVRVRAYRLTCSAPHDNPFEFCTAARGLRDCRIGGPYQEASREPAARRSGAGNSTHVAYTLDWLSELWSVLIVARAINQHAGRLRRACQPQTFLREHRDTTHPDIGKRAQVRSRPMAETCIMKRMWAVLAVPLMLAATFTGCGPAAAAAASRACADRATAPASRTGNWTTVHAPSPGTVTNELSGVAVVSACDAWAVGNYGTDKVYRQRPERRGRRFRHQRLGRGRVGRRRPASPRRPLLLSQYSPTRLHTPIGNCPPIEYEQHLAPQSLVA
jgi:hypothetical protein